MSRPIHFDLSADNPQRAVEFYHKVLGWKIEKWEGPTEYWMMSTGDEAEPGITGGIAGRVDSTDSTAMVFDVNSIDKVAQVIEASGGTSREPKKTIPGVGYLIICRDTEGNTFGIMEVDQSVK